MMYSALICTFAGLSTALGAVAVILNGGIDKNKMSFFQGFAAGVMLAVSLLDLIRESYINYSAYMPVSAALRAVLQLFCCGMIIGRAMSGLACPSPRQGESGENFSVRRIAFLTTAVMVLHNLPEGMLTMFAGARDTSFGLRMAIAVALHNIPEGMAIASPVLYITKNGKKAFLQALWAGMAEPLGGIASYLLLRKFISAAFLNGLMPIIGGVMCQAAVFELIPSAVKISNIKHTICGIITGIAVMCIGLFMF